MDTAAILAVVAVGLAALAWPFAAWRLKHRRRERLMRQPFPAAWERILEERVSRHRRLPPGLKDEIRRDILVFLGEKRFEGCGGLEITDEIRVVIAAEACLLLLNRKPSFYPGLTTVLVYPHPYVAGTFRAIGREYLEEPVTRVGESWTRGEVVLAWDYVEQSARRGNGGRNVVVHEFAHQLDQEDGSADGAPILGSRSRYASWARVLGADFERLKSDVLQNRPTLLDDYGTTNPAEFFAVASEAFFDKSREMRERDPELYAELKDYYKLDPAEWEAGGASPGPASPSPPGA